MIRFRKKASKSAKLITITKFEICNLKFLTYLRPFKMDVKRAKIAIIGPGRVGPAIGILAERNGYDVVAIGGADVSRAEAVAKTISRSTRGCDIIQAAAAGEIVLLTVPDDAIASVCEKIAQAKAFKPGAIVAHCSGALASDILAPAKAAGCPVGSMHPLQTFPSTQTAVEKMVGVYCFIEGDEQAVAALERLARDIGCLPVRIDPAAKPLYHASAVMACNYLTALLDAALYLAGEAGINRDTAMSALTPLVRATFENIHAEGTEQALTGPIARGDLETVERHLAALAGEPGEIDAFYRAAGLWTVGLAERKGTIDPATTQSLRRLLEK